ncbi:MAG: methyltransferase [Arcanobacterium sp.]
MKADFAFDFAVLRQDLLPYTQDAVAGERTLVAELYADLPRSLTPTPVTPLTSTPGSTVALLDRFFGRREVITRAELEQILPTTLSHYELSELPFVAVEDGGVRATITIQPFTAPGTSHTAPGTLLATSTSLTDAEPRTLWFASDGEAQHHAGELATDHVMGIGGATRTLANLASYHRGQRVLDLGTGCGIHAILAAKAGAEVVATDISARALEFAQFNALLNEVVIETRLGSLYEPVNGEQFDVIVSNPPFVITPQEVRTEIGTMEYRDGGASGDALIASVITDMPDHLTAEGRAYLLGNWEIALANNSAENDGEVAAAPWDDRPRTWFATTGLDAVIIQRDVLLPAEYAKLWLRDGGILPGHPRYHTAYKSWLAGFYQRNLAAVGMGYLLLGKNQLDTPPTQVFHDLRGPAPQSPGPVTQRMWANRVVPALDNLRLTHCDLQEHRIYAPGADEPQTITFHLPDGFGTQIHADTYLAAFVSVCDGELTVAQIIGALADIMDADPQEIRAHLAPQIRNMLQLGMLAIDC